MRLTCVVLLLFGYANLWSQSPADSSHEPQDSTNVGGRRWYFVDEITVTAPRSRLPLYQIPNSIQVLEKKDIQRVEAGLSLEETLRSVPGVIVNNRSNFSLGDRISIRGVGSRAAFGVRGLKIILDDVPLTMPDGQSQLNNLDLGSVGRIEVWRGPSSSLYGNSSGGLLNIESSLPAYPGWLFRPRVILGSHGLRKWQGQAAGSIGKHSFLVKLTQFKSDGYREHSAAKSTSMNVIGRYKFSHNLALKTVLNIVDSPYLLNPSSLSKEDSENSPEMARFFVKSQGSGKKIQQAQGGMTLTYKDNLKTTVYGLRRDLSNPIPGRIIELERQAGGIRSVFEKHFALGEAILRWTVGSDFEFQSDARQEFANEGLPAELLGTLTGESVFEQVRYGGKLLDQDESVRSWGAFSEWQLTRGRWSLTGGARLDLFRFKAEDHFVMDGKDDSGKRRMEKFSPRAGLNYRAKPTLSIFSNTAAGFQTPTTTELSNRPDGAGGFNPFLQPEKLQSYEVGLKGLWVRQRLSYEAAFYRLDVRDMLIPFQVPGTASEEIFFRNAGQTRNHGLEINVNWAPIDNFRASLSYTAMDFEFKDYEVEISADGQTDLTQLAGNDVPGVPPQHLFFDMTYEHPLGGYVELNLQWFAKTFANDFNGPAPGSAQAVGDFENAAYFLTDFRLALNRQFGRFNLEWLLGVNNLFDQPYNGSIVPNASGNRFFEPAPGRNVYNGLTLSYLR